MITTVTQGRGRSAALVLLAAIAVLVAQIFGPRYVATLFGFVFFVHQFGSFAGAWWGGWVYDSTGSYDLVWSVSIALGILAAILHWPIRDAAVPRLARVELAGGD